jgi:hypothetical protein
LLAFERIEDNDYILDQLSSDFLKFILLVTSSSHRIQSITRIESASFQSIQIILMKDETSFFLILLGTIYPILKDLNLESEEMRFKYELDSQNNQ